MTSLLRDGRFAVRLLRRSPGFTAVATLTLALGIGSTTAIFSVVYGLFFAPLPYHQADRLVMVWEQEGGDRTRPDAGELRCLQAASHRRSRTSTRGAAGP